MLPEKTEQLLEIKCPYDRYSKKHDKVFKCNSLCVKVTAGSSGEAHCRKCGLEFLFTSSVDAQVQTGVRAEPLR